MKLDRFLPLLAGALVTVGCSSSPAPSDAGKDGSTKDSSTPDAGSDSSAQDSGGGCVDTASCDTAGSTSACVQCYAGLSACAAGASAYSQVLNQLVTCSGCTAGGSCYTACQTDAGPDPICSGGTGGTACVNCLSALTGTDSCFQAANAACSSDANCVTFAGVLQGCP